MLQPGVPRAYAYSRAHVMKTILTEAFDAKFDASEDVSDTIDGSATPTWSRGASTSIFPPGS
jgi:hypothetical protein